MKIYPYMAVPALLLAVAACSNDDEMPVTPYDANSNAVRIQPAVSGIVMTRTSPEATTSTQFAKGDRIKVSRDGAGFYTYTFDGNNWLPEQGTSYIVWTSASETAMQLQACYPATASMTSYDLPQNQGGVDLNDGKPYSIADADYMTYSGGVERGAANTAAFTMQRRTVRIRVTIDGFGDQYAADSRCGVKIRSPYTTVSVDYSGTGPAVTGAGNTLLVTPLNGTDMTVNSIATALVAPSSTAMDSENFMEVAVNGETLYVRGIPAHEAGYSYDYHLTVGKNGIVINSVQVNPWNDPVDVNGGTAEEKTDGPDASTHTVKTSAAGQIAANPGWIAEAVGGGNSLGISGPMNSEDLTAIANYLKDISGTTIDLDLSEAELTSVPYGTFMGLYAGPYNERIKSLGKVSLPATLTEIGESAFRNCPSFTVANWDELTSLTTIKSCAFMGSGLNGDITLPESITTIGYMAFYQTAITSIVFPSSITSIDVQMFYQSQNLKAVTFKGNVTFFDIRVFEGCSALEEINLSACTAVPAYQDATVFEGFSDSEMERITLKVKSGMVESFKADAIWGKCNVTAAD